MPFIDKKQNKSSIKAKQMRHIEKRLKKRDNAEQSLERLGYITLNLWLSLSTSEFTKDNHYKSHRPE